jgi:hypothetical protein
MSSGYLILNSFDRQLDKGNLDVSHLFERVLRYGAIDVRRHTYPGGITFHKHLGPERYQEAEMKLCFEKDIVFTTFATVASDFMHHKAPLSKIHWFRIVLDEGENHFSRQLNYYSHPQPYSP